MDGKAVIFCAPSGAGKTTIVRYLTKQIPSLEFSISATTRSPRVNEENGKDYFFLTVEEFKEKISNDELAEWEEVYLGRYYGTLKSELNRIWKNGNHVIFDIDVKGALELKKQLGEKALAVFVKVDSVEVLRERLKNRNSENPDSLNERVDKAFEEMKNEGQFDVTIVNHDLDMALEEAENIVTEFLK